MVDELMPNVVQKLTREVEHVLQILPGLVTRDDLTAATEPLATREELRKAIEPLATREELRKAIEPLATQEQLHVAIDALRTELHADIAESRRHSTVLYEDLRDDNRIILEHLLTLSNRVDALARR